MLLGLSSSARSPLIANIRPPGRSSGTLHFVSLSSEATARETTASISPTCCRTARSSARPRTTVHLDTEFVDHLAQEVAAAKQWFDERHAKVRPGQRQRYPGQAGTTTDVGDPLAGTEQFRDRGTVEDMAVPQPVHFSGPE